jgi:YidC/Oxa1 family membrane protein insertase
MIFYDLFIYPIELLLKSIYEHSLTYTYDYVLSIILLSLLINIILIPAYNFTEKLQRKESDAINKLKPMVDEFKRVYKGAELHAITARLYKTHNYHPFYSLRSLLGLLIQMPLFIAAYHFLSNYEQIREVRVLLFHDLGAPDKWLKIGDYAVNIMPFIMTAINLLSAYIYTKNMSNSIRNQTFILSFVFLILLYNSPALLLIYWTVNNIFGLFKNIYTAIWK